MRKDEVTCKDHPRCSRCGAPLVFWWPASVAACPNECLITHGIDASLHFMAVNEDGTGVCTYHGDER